jgi:hypothetical protein
MRIGSNKTGPNRYQYIIDLVSQITEKQVIKIQVDEFWYEIHSLPVPIPSIFE